MDKLSNFFKNHPLLALFLTSVITICCINFAITVQSKRFSDTAPEDMNTWTFEDRTAEPAPSFRGGEESETVQTALSDLTEPFEQRNQQFSHTVEKPVTQDDIFTLCDPEESADFDLVSNTVSEPSPAGDAVTDGLESVQAPSAETAVSENAADFFAEEEETVSLTETLSNGMTESAEVTGGETAEPQFAAIPEADDAETAETEPVEFFDVAPAETSDVAADSDIAAEMTGNLAAEASLSENGSDDISAAAAGKTDEQQAGSIEVAESGDELTTTDLNWIPADLSEETRETAVSDIEDLSEDDLGWDIADTAADENTVVARAEKEPVSGYEPNEPEQIVAEKYDTGNAGNALEAGDNSEADAVQVAGSSENVQAEPGDSAEPAAGTSGESAEVAASETPAEETVQTGEPDAGYVETDPAPAEAVPAEGDRCARQACCAANRTAPVQKQTAEPAAVTADNTETAADNIETAADDTAAVSASDKAAAANGIEIWAVSTEQISGFTVDVNQLFCWRAEHGKFITSSVNEYKSTLTAEIPTVILIHGNMTDWSGALRHAQSLKYRIDQMRTRQGIETPYRLVIWKWPSERQDQRIRSDSQMKAYLADLNGFYLASFLNAINGTGADVTLLGFSFGARTIGSALELLAGGVSLGRTIPEEMRYTAGNRYHAILLAGACNYGDFSTRGQYAHGSALLSSMVNVFNPVDSALRFYPLLYGPAGPQAVGVAPVDPNTAPTSYKDRLWSINSSAYGPQHNFDNLLYSICDPILGNMVYAGKIWTAADAIPSVSNAVVDPVIRQRSEAEQQEPEAEKTETESDQEATIVAESL
ncbi:MAG: hypothetical protein IJG60_01915 [Thermoguttaceae bacterium]|nr:hypothetical protein [Thermoguttaceae bacterium]